MRAIAAFCSVAFIYSVYIAATSYQAGDIAGYSGFRVGVATALVAAMTGVVFYKGYVDLWKGFIGQAKWLRRNF